jgi:hypothetical protein
MATLYFNLLVDDVTGIAVVVVVVVVVVVAAKDNRISIVE